MENVSVLNTIAKNIIGYDGIIFVFAAMSAHIRQSVREQPDT